VPRNTAASGVRRWQWQHPVPDTGNVDARRIERTGYRIEPLDDARHGSTRYERDPAAGLPRTMLEHVQQRRLPSPTLTEHSLRLPARTRINLLISITLIHFDAILLSAMTSGDAIGVFAYQLVRGPKPLDAPSTPTPERLSVDGERPVRLPA